MEPRDQYYGDRSAAVDDPAGNQWWIATHKEDLSEAELEARMKQNRPS
jgi:PhnB protein